MTDVQEELLDYCEKILTYKPVFDRLCSLAEGKLLAAAKDGYELQNFKVVAGRRSREWGVSEQDLVNHFGNLIYKERELRSPAAAEEQFGKELVPGIFITSTPGANRLDLKASIKQAVSYNTSEFN